jgi:hypothetical protein
VLELKAKNHQYIQER